MIRNHIKMALRNLSRNKLNSFINIIGLAIGIGASVIMFLYAVNELSYNSNFKNADRIYMVYKERHLPTGVQITRDTWPAPRPAILSDPDIRPGLINRSRC